ncbi:MAG: hypothetical protein JO104_09735 [Candidatus Eremiobacteraeota bacterium]|nr:hypothetical protein [Candidatus Eremiobacteraeota bacterium]
MNRTLRASSWILSGMAAIIGLLAILTAFAPDWIEIVLRWDPDLRDGSFERFVIIGVCCASAPSFVLAALERRMQTADDA